MFRIVKAEALEGYRLRLVYADGTEGVVDVSDLVGKGVFALWEDYEAFKKVEIGSSGELVWGDSVDLCPDALYIKITGKTAEQLFPNLVQQNAIGGPN